MPALARLLGAMRVQKMWAVYCPLESNGHLFMARKKGSKNYAAAFKRQVVAEAFSGASVAAVARKHGLNANMVHLWRRDARFQPEAGAGTLLPVELVQPQTPPRSQPHSHIEVVTRGGHRVIVSGVVDPGAIAGLFRALGTA